ncbi:DUF937 domain-containing protein [Ollibium composti]|uniref:DUF937 domain-containing protein n=1 Tax=Ollibium composti TaxID=2675109 RepID=A0ABY2Q4R0_9HYPH|nr:DUF937 domain-containing protein [Mesorhizobium composti]THF55806.1 DUF937 domain-containing protein [Mesorhizobium composti]
MMPLFDMLAQAQNGQGLELLARQFNLSQQQAQLAVEALLPAFSQGLKRSTSDAQGLGGFMNALASGQYGQFFENANQAFSQQGVNQGNDVLGQLFGSKDLSRAVAAQAAQATGIGSQVLQQMLPVIASMLMGGLFKQTTNQMPQAGMQSAQAGGFGSANNPLGQIIEEMMKQGGGMMGGQPAPQQRQAPQGRAQQGQNPLGDNPWGKILEDMMGGGQQSGQARQRQAPQPDPEPANPGGRPRNPYDDIFGKMFETGRQQRDDYEKNMCSVFDQFLRGMDRNR